MKRVLTAAFAVAVVAAPGLAGATGGDLTLPPEPAPQVEALVASGPDAEPAPVLEPVPAVEPIPGFEPVPAVEPVAELEPVAEIEPVTAVPAPPATEAPAAVDAAEDEAYATRLHAELCLARPVFCQVDRSGKYIGSGAG